MKPYSEPIDPFGYESMSDEDKMKHQKKLRRQYLNSLSPEERAVEVSRSRTAAAAASVASRKQWGCKRRAINDNPLVSMSIHISTAKTIRELASVRGWGVAETVDKIVDKAINLI